MDRVGHDIGTFHNAKLPFLEPCVYHLVILSYRWLNSSSLFGQLATVRFVLLPLKTLNAALTNCHGITILPTPASCKILRLVLQT